MVRLAGAQALEIFVALHATAHNFMRIHAAERQEPFPDGN
jgi:hypothetical protein